MLLQTLKKSIYDEKFSITDQEISLKTTDKIKLKIKLLSALWVLLTVVISPILIILGLRTKRETPRLSEASGKPFGAFKNTHSDDYKHLLFIGESPVAGVGVDTYDLSLAAQSAHHFSELEGKSVSWHALGKNGITIDKTIDLLVPNIANRTTDYLVIMLGVNDVTSISSLNHWHRSISRLICEIRKLTKAKIIFYGCPPLGQFPALPKLLALAAGTRASLLDLVTQFHPLNGKEFYFSTFKTSIMSSHFAADGYHPSELGCAEMGKKIAEDLMILADTELATV